MFASLFNLLVNSGVISVLLSILIILVLAFIVFIYMKMLYKPTGFGYPSTMKRFFAFIYDMIQLNFGLIVLALAYMLFTGTLIENFRSYGEYLSNSKDGTYYIGLNTVKADFKTVQFYLIIAFSIYSFITEALGSRTLGKRVMGIKVGEGDQKPALWQSLVRNIVKIPIIAMWPVFLFISLIDKKRRWIHDWVSKSVLISVNE